MGADETVISFGDAVERKARDERWRMLASGLQYLKLQLLSRSGSIPWQEHLAYSHEVDPQTGTQVNQAYQVHGLTLAVTDEVLEGADDTLSMRQKRLILMPGGGWIVAECGDGDEDDTSAILMHIDEKTLAEEYEDLATQAEAVLQSMTRDRIGRVSQ